MIKEKKTNFSFLNPIWAGYRAILFLFLLTLFVFFFVGKTDNSSFRSINSFWNLGHIGFFAIFAFLFFSIFKRVSDADYLRQILWTLLITLLFGAAVEIIQSKTGRNSDFHDILRNMTGALAALFFLSPKRTALDLKRLRTLQAGVFFVVLLETIPFITEFSDERIAARQFPLLSGFEFFTETGRWSGTACYKIDNNIADTGKRSLKVRLGTTEYSGVSLSHFPGNWDGYERFQFSVYNPQKSQLNLTCRIHDRLHEKTDRLYKDRFNRNFTIKEGWNRVEIELDDVINAPENRRMDIDAIKSIGIFAFRLDNPVLIYIDDFRLVK